MLDTLLTGGMVIDGAGNDAVLADVGIRDGKIVVVGATDEPLGTKPLHPAFTTTPCAFM